MVIIGQVFVISVQESSPHGMSFGMDPLKVLLHVLWTVLLSLLRDTARSRYPRYLVFDHVYYISLEVLSVKHAKCYSQCHHIHLGIDL